MGFLFLRIKYFYLIHQDQGSRSESSGRGSPPSGRLPTPSAEGRALARQVLNFGLFLGVCHKNGNTLFCFGGNKALIDNFRRDSKNMRVASGKQFHIFFASD